MVVLPIFLIATLACVQLGLLAFAYLRLEAAANASARSFLATQDLAQAHRAAAYSLVPASPRIPLRPGGDPPDFLAGLASKDRALGATLRDGLQRAIYALARSSVNVCVLRAGSTVANPPGQLAADAVVRVRVYYAYPLLMPLVGGLFAGGVGPQWKTDDALDLLPLIGGTAPPVSGLRGLALTLALEKWLDRWPQRVMQRTVHVLWLGPSPAGAQSC